MPHAGETPSALERLLRRDRLAVGFGLAAIAVIAWIFLFRMSADMRSREAEAQMHAAMGMAGMHTWGSDSWLTLFSMWAVMMVGMMLPSAAPVVLLVLAVYRRRSDRRARISAFAFLAGYALLWTAFSAVAAAAQVGLHQAALLSPDMTSRSATLGGAILLIAGIYQWLPIKTACLSHCQSPLGFLSSHWREGAVGALRMGARHGAFCVGCCWALMTLLFVVGVMNLLWVAALMAFVLLEKLTRHGQLFARATGVLLVAWGTYVLVQPLTR